MSFRDVAKGLTGQNRGIRAVLILLDSRSLLADLRASQRGLSIRLGGSAHGERGDRHSYFQIDCTIANDRCCWVNRVIRNERVLPNRPGALIPDIEGES